MRTNVLVGTAVWALAACVDPVAAVPSPNLPLQARAASAATGITRTGPARLSMDVQGADIRTVLRSISEFSGRNIVVGKEVKGLVSIHLADVNWRDALVAVLRTHELDFVEEGTIIRVDQASKLRQELLERETNEARRIEVMPLVTRVFRMQYAQAKEIQPSIQSLLTKRGSVETDPRTNSLIVTDIEYRLGDAEKMALELDSKTPQIEITAKLVDVDQSALRQLGITWGVRNLDIDHVTNHPSGDPQIGVDASNDETVGTIAGVLTRPWGTIDAMLEALETQRKANIISNPRITTVDNREAKILVGQKIPLIVQDVAGNALTQLQTIGIQLKVTPHLTAEKRIVLDLHPEVSDLSTQSTVQGGVIINTSEADTRVMVDNGQTAVIGGLIRTNESEVQRGVPILMDIPLLGALFRNKATVKQKRELVIFVTPRLVENFATQD
jgi:type IV pilus assembly protein PilQ